MSLVQKTANFQTIEMIVLVSASYMVQTNDCNYRSTKKIVEFLNHFNGRYFNAVKFQQKAYSRTLETSQDTDVGEDVQFIEQWGDVTSILNIFYQICDRLSIPIAQRCVLAKRKEIENRIKAAVKNQYMNPRKKANAQPIKAIQDALLTTLQMNISKFCEHYHTDAHTLRKHTVALFKAINSGIVYDENTFGAFVTDVLKLQLKNGLPVKVENLKFDNTPSNVGNVITIANIHTVKGLEAKAVLTIAKTEAELLLWLESDHSVREAKRTNETTDYSRLGYVAFSRAEQLLCIACLEKVNLSTQQILAKLNVNWLCS